MKIITGLTKGLCRLLRQNTASFLVSPRVDDLYNGPWYLLYKVSSFPSTSSLFSLTFMRCLVLRFMKEPDMEGYYQMIPRKGVGLGALELSSHEKKYSNGC